MKSYNIEALEYIAKLSEGGMRDAITLVDKVCSFNSQLTLENVVQALGTTDYDTMLKLTDCLISEDRKDVVDIIERLHDSGKDLKQFVRDYGYFLLDVQKYAVGCDFEYLQIPKLDAYEKWLKGIQAEDLDWLLKVLDTVLQLSTSIKYSSFVKADIEASLLLL